MCKTMLFIIVSVNKSVKCDKSRENFPCLHCREYRSYTRQLVCPECRDEVDIDFVKGIESLPLDFKLSKLVDLFQFVKVQYLQ